MRRLRHGWAGGRLLGLSLRGLRDGLRLGERARLRPCGAHYQGEENGEKRERYSPRFVQFGFSGTLRGAVPRQVRIPRHAGADNCTE